MIGMVEAPTRANLPRPFLSSDIARFCPSVPPAEALDGTGVSFPLGHDLFPWSALTSFPLEVLFLFRKKISRLQDQFWKFSGYR